MKIWIDKQGGMQYHKPHCEMIKPRPNIPRFPYEEVEHDMRGLGTKYIDGRWYSPCPFCFGYGRRK